MRHFVSGQPCEFCSKVLFLCSLLGCSAAGGPVRPAPWGRWASKASSGQGPRSTRGCRLTKPRQEKGGETKVADRLTMFLFFIPTSKRCHFRRRTLHGDCSSKRRKMHIYFCNLVGMPFGEPAAQAPCAHRFGVVKIFILGPQEVVH